MLICLIPFLAGTIGTWLVPQSVPYGRLVCLWISFSYTATWTLSMSVATANTAGHTKKVATNAMLLIGRYHPTRMSTTTKLIICRLLSRKLHRPLLLPDEAGAQIRARSRHDVLLHRHSSPEHHRDLGPAVEAECLEKEVECCQ